MTHTVAQSLVGLAGSGLTEYCIQTYRQLLQQTSPERILIVVRNQRQKLDIQKRLQPLEPILVGPLRVHTFLSLIYEAVTTHWSEIVAAERSLPVCFAPAFLLKDLTQYVLSKTCELCPQHASIFSYSGLRTYQVWDQLSSIAYIAGASGLAPQDISPRLLEAWPDLEDENRLRSLGAISCCIQRLRAETLKLGSLEVGTVIDLFQRLLLPLPSFWAGFDHLIVDQVEDSCGVAIEFYQQAQQKLQSLTFTYTVGGGASLIGVPTTAADFVLEETQHRTTHQTYKGSPTWAAFGLKLAQQIDPEFDHDFQLHPEAPPKLVRLEGETYYEAIEIMIDDIQILLQRGIQPAQIAIIAPTLDAALTLTLQNRLPPPVVPITPYPALVKYPLIRAILTLIELAHPSWQAFPTASEFSVMIVTLLGLDPIRAELLTQDVLDSVGRRLRSSLSVRFPERVGFTHCHTYQQLQDWLIQYQQNEPLPLPTFVRQVVVDWIIPRLNSEADQALIQTFMETAQRFCRDLSTLPQRDFITLIRSGLTPSRSDLQTDYSSSLVVATPFEYINQGLSADYQYWFDLNNPLWSRSRWRPLYNSDVLTLEWDHQTFGVAADTTARSKVLANTLLNLCCRVRQTVRLVLSNFNSRGEDTVGTLDTKILDLWSTWTQDSTEME